MAIRPKVSATGMSAISTNVSGPDTSSPLPLLKLPRRKAPKLPKRCSFAPGWRRQSALSQHLALMREDRLVASRRDGLTMRYLIADPIAASVLETLRKSYCP
jgi:hypothetical protein